MILNQSEGEYPKSILNLSNTTIKSVEDFIYLGTYIRFDNVRLLSVIDWLKHEKQHKKYNTLYKIFIITVLQLFHL